MKTKLKVNKNGLEEEGWNWDKRVQLDLAVHEERCADCRDPQKLRPGEKRFAVKNTLTREFLHVVALDSDAAKRALGWPLDVGVCWAMIVEDAERTGAAMSEETKQRLREINLARRGLRRAEPRERREDPRHRHMCLKCGDFWVHTDSDCLREETRTCSFCEPDMGGLTEDPSCDRVSVEDRINNDERKEDDFMDLKTLVKEFIDGQITVKDEETKKLVLDKNKLFDLAKANGVDAAKYRKDFVPENAGRIRMTIGNMIRGAAVRNGKLITLGGGTKTVPADLLPAKKEKKVAPPKAAKKKAA